MSTATSPAGGLVRSATGSRTGGVGTVLTFAGLSLGLAAAATLGGLPPTLVPFVLALGPTVIALTFAAREGDGAIRRLLKTAITRPDRRVGTRSSRFRSRGRSASWASPSPSATRRSGCSTRSSRRSSSCRSSS